MTTVPPARRLPAWLDELRRFLRLRSLFLVHGNIYDQYLYPHGDGFRIARSLRDLLQLLLRDEGYDLVSAYDVVSGFEPLVGTLEEVLEAGGQRAEARTPLALESALVLVHELMCNRRRPTASILDFASRLTSNPNELTADESQTLIRLIKGVRESHMFHDRAGIRNILICICDKQNDLPTWLFFENPLTRAIGIPKPERHDRRFFIESQRARFHAGSEIEPGEPLDRVTQRFLDLTDGMSYRELDNLRAISINERISLPEVRKIIDLYRYGIRHSPWNDLEPSKIRVLEQSLRRRVKGQDAAIRRTAQIVKRAAAGMTGINRSGPGNRPRGVMFLAGPTGVGKTELAKALAEEIFGDESVLVRFDMSEYSHEHSDEKLLGAPPGYVGYDEGGQLTNHIKAHPFSIILFDEFEKAHPKLFDKFLQILDDGRLTDGKGETVYFSQALILFTSNLGMVREDERGVPEPNVHYDMTYEVLRKRILDEIKRFFTATLKRPEIYYRFGENFVVFDFIKPDVGRTIMDSVVHTVVDNLARQKEIALEIPVSVLSPLFTDHVEAGLPGGGRGVHNKIEESLVNPLSTFIVDGGIGAGARIEVTYEGKELRFHVAS